jgi:hypothetical protein
MLRQSFGRKIVSNGLPLALALLVSTPALAGGLYITEFGQPGMGLSGAGWIRIREMCRLSFSPEWLQLRPASVDFPPLKAFKLFFIPICNAVAAGKQQSQSKGRYPVTH